MGKARKGRGKEGRLDPTGVPTTQDVASAETSREQELLQTMTSAVTEDREIACHAIATSLAADSGTKTLETLLRLGAVTSLIERLHDKEESVRLAAAIALRNVAVCGPIEVCEKMVEQGIMIPIVDAFRKACAALMTPEIQADEARRASMFEYIDQLVCLILKLCESSEDATTIVTRSRLVPLLLDCLHPGGVPDDLVLSAAECLHALTDRNGDLVEQIHAVPTAADTIVALLDSESVPLRLRVLAAGIMLNVTSGDASLSVLERVVPVLRAALSVDLLPPLVALMPSAKHKEAADARAAWRQDAAAQRIAAEILSNACSSREGDEWAAVDEDFADEEHDGATAGLTGEEAPPGVGGVPEVVLRIVDPAATLSLIAPRCTMAPPEVHDAASGGEALALTKTYYDVLGRLLGLTGNLTLCLPDSDPAAYASVWSGLSSLASQAASLLPLATRGIVDPLEGVSGAMLSLLKKCQGTEPPVLVPGEDEVRALVETARGSPTEGVRSNAVLCIAIVGKMPAHAGMHEMILDALLDCLSDQSLAVVADATNAIFDVFDEVDFNEAFARLGALARLRQLLDTLKRAIKTGMKSLDRDLLGRLDETRMNLARFIKYKQAQF